MTFPLQKWSESRPCTTHEYIAFRKYLLSKTTLTRKTIDRRVKAFNHLSRMVDLFDSDKVVKFLNQSSCKNGTRNIVVQAYHDYQRMYNLEPVPINKYRVIQVLSFVPFNTEIGQLIAGLQQVKFSMDR